MSRLQKAILLIIIILISSAPSMVIASPDYHPPIHQDNPAIAGNSSSQYIFIYSCFKGQLQELTMQPNSTGYLMYPSWTFVLISQSRANYTIYVQGHEIDQGTVQGQKNISENISKSGITVQVSLGGTVYRYNDVLISSVPISKYYGPKPPALVASAGEILSAAIAGAIAIAIWMVIGAFTVRPWVMDRMKRRPKRR